VRGVLAEVMTRNDAMLRVFRRGEHDTSVTTSDGIHTVRMVFAGRD
jgi:hypothetical protein